MDSPNFYYGFPLLAIPTNQSDTFCMDWSRPVHTTTMRKDPCKLHANEKQIELIINAIFELIAIINSGFP